MPSLANVLCDDAWRLPDRRAWHKIARIVARRSVKRVRGARCLLRRH